MGIHLSFSNALARRVRENDCHFLVTGANGWLGRSTLEMLRQALGGDFARRVIALGSQQGEMVFSDGQRHRIDALLQWTPTPDHQYVVFHYAFLTKDKVSNIPIEEYIERNCVISCVVRTWLDRGNVKGVVLPSSGAVYDHIHKSARDTDAGIYGRLKLEDENAFAESCARLGAGLIIPRVFNLSGPFINKFDSYALASFIFKILQSQAIEIRARRQVLRSYYFVGDMIELCLAGLLEQQSPTTERFDVAGAEVVELTQLAERVCKILSKPDWSIERPPLVEQETEDRYIGNREFIQKIETKLGMVPMCLDDQIRATAAYISNVIH